ncbi:glycosyltransferase [Vibrio sp. SG41-7]|uniref:glycosyltransferase n=1 Tax=Vibrio sp. SG41-7 TaxID=2760973 RepID=UPI00160267D1|nr:glycosyltransferase [Vibrio sp. SG41-7]MBB1464850.1 glycosyltransferase [Vibrio sp. SG41-7]
MKVLHLGKYYSPFSGGIEFVNQQIAEYSVEKGVETTVLCFGHKNENTVINGVSVIRCKSNVKLLSQPLSLGYLIKGFMEALRHDTLHVHSPNFLAFILVLLLPWKRTIVHWHGEVYDKGLIGFLVSPLVYLTLVVANKIIVTTRLQQLSSSYLRYFKYKTVVIPIGLIDYARELHVDSSNDAVLAKFSLKKSEYILFVGRLVHFKGCTDLITAFSEIKCKNVKLVIVGEGPEEKNLLDLVEKFSLGSRVVFTGNLNSLTKLSENSTYKERLLPSLISNAKCLAFPSIHKAESFGITMVESMVFSTPIISTIIPGSGSSWVNRNMVSGLQYPVGDIDILSDKIELMFSDDLLYKRLSKNARRRYENIFRSELAVSKILRLYK